MANSTTDNVPHFSVVPKSDFWISWVAANAGGTILGVITFYFVAASVGLFSGPSLPGQYSNWEIIQSSIILDLQVFLPFGAFIGLMQWLVLRQHLGRVGLWFLTSAVAMFIGGLASDLIPHFLRLTSISIQPFILWCLFGLVSGVLQWIILRKQVLYSSWWIFANFLAGSFSGVFFTDRLGMIGGCLGWAFSAIITGGIMLFLIQKKKESDHINVA